MVRNVGPPLLLGRVLSPVIRLALLNLRYGCVNVVQSLLPLPMILVPGGVQMCCSLLQQLPCVVHVRKRITGLRGGERFGWNFVVYRRGMFLQKSIDSRLREADRGVDMLECSFPVTTKFTRSFLQFRLGLFKER